MTPEIQQQIVKALSLEGKSQEEIEKVVSALGGIILQTVFLKVTESLSDEQIILFDEVLQSADQSALQAFFQSEVPHLDSIVTESSKEVIATYQQA